MSTFVVDSNFFIQAHRTIYPLDVVPSFWKKVVELANREVIKSIDKVKDEIYRNDDDLKGWCERSLPSDFFQKTSPATPDYALLARWVASDDVRSRYDKKAIDDFLDDSRADAFLVSFAMSNKEDLVIVTYEVSVPASKRSIKIPDVCNSHGVKCMNTIDMFRAIGETF
jgi:hypothetical protein